MPTIGRYEILPLLAGFVGRGVAKKAGLGLARKGLGRSIARRGSRRVIPQRRRRRRSDGGSGPTGKKTKQTPRAQRRIQQQNFNPEIWGMQQPMAIQGQIPMMPWGIQPTMFPQQMQMQMQMQTPQRPQRSTVPRKTKQKKRKNKTK